MMAALREATRHVGNSIYPRRPDQAGTRDLDILYRSEIIVLKTGSGNSIQSRSVAHFCRRVISRQKSSLNSACLASVSALAPSREHSNSKSIFSIRLTPWDPNWSDSLTDVLSFREPVVESNSSDAFISVAMVN